MRMRGKVGIMGKTKTLVIFITKNVLINDMLSLIKLVGGEVGIIISRAYILLVPRNSTSMVDIAFDLNDMGCNIIIPRKFITGKDIKPPPTDEQERASHYHSRGHDPLPIPNYCFADHKKITMASELFPPRFKNPTRWLEYSGSPYFPR